MPVLKTTLRTCATSHKLIIADTGILDKDLHVVFEGQGAKFCPVSAAGIVCTENISTYCVPSLFD